MPSRETQIFIEASVKMNLTPEELAIADALERLGSFQAASLIRNLRYLADSNLETAQTNLATSKRLTERITFLEGYQYKDRFALGVIVPILIMLALGAIHSMLQTPQPSTIPPPMVLGGIFLVVFLLCGAIAALIGGLTNWSPPKSPDGSIQ